MTAAAILAAFLAAALVALLVSCQQDEAETDGDQVTAVPPTQQQPMHAEEESPAADQQSAAQAGTLAQRIAEFKAGREQPPEVKQVFEETTRKLREQGISAAAVQAGQQAPDFELTTDSGDEYRLSEMLARGPVVLIFFRGAW